jgi:MFS family permease
VTIPIYGRLADLYGRKRVFFAGAGLFLFASTLCGVAWGMLPLVLFRALQGAGAGAIQPIAITIIGDIYQPTERARIQGYISGEAARPNAPVEPAPQFPDGSSRAFASH